MPKALFICFRLSFSRKRWWETLPEPLETTRGRSCLAYPRRAEDAAEFPAADGSTVNLHRYPWGERHEDFVAGIEDPASGLGWTAVVRPTEGDLILTLRNARALPMTMLWHSNGGRDYAPWNGRHTGCLGVEEGAALPVLGLSSRETPDPRTAAGQPALLTLDPLGTVEVRHILGAIRYQSIEYESEDLLAMEIDQRALAGIFLAFQYPVEIPGVSNSNFLKSIINTKRVYQGQPELNALDMLKYIRSKMSAIEMDESLLKRSLNDGFSGGEKKRNEILQMTLLEPKLAILDETDSGLDIDALRIVAEGVTQLRSADRSFIVVTHYQRLLNYIVPDFVHVLANGKIITTVTNHLLRN